MIFFGWLILCVSVVQATTNITYDESLAKEMSTYASIAYTEPSQVLDWKFPNSDCNVETANFSITGTFIANQTWSWSVAFGYAGVDHVSKRIIVAFKGTNCTTDLLDDLAQFLKNFLYFTTPCVLSSGLAPNVHSGFCYYYQSLASQGIGEHVIKLYNTYGYPIYVTGHSLGGAAGTLFAMDLTYQYRVPIFLYTFGEPRVGDSSIHSFYQNTTTMTIWRVVHSKDIISHLTPCCSYFYRNCDLTPTCPYHTGPEAYYEAENMTILGLCNNPESWDCSNSQTFDLTLNDHLYYFGRRVGTFCGTTPTRRYPTH